MLHWASTEISPVLLSLAVWLTMSPPNVVHGSSKDLGDIYTKNVDIFLSGPFLFLNFSCGFNYSKLSPGSLSQEGWVSPEVLLIPVPRMFHKNRGLVQCLSFFHVSAPSQRFPVCALFPILCRTHGYDHPGGIYLPTRGRTLAQVLWSAPFSLPSSCTLDNLPFRSFLKIPKVQVLASHTQISTARKLVSGFHYPPTPPSGSCFSSPSLTLTSHPKINPLFIIVLLP
jgi:hypothetical protein